jgi:predicted Zn-dependent peptidase
MTASELQKTKNQMMKNWVDSVKTIHGKAQNLALYETTTGNYQNLFEDLNRYQSIQVGDVKRVGDKYLKQKRSVVTVKGKKGSGK